MITHARNLYLLRLYEKFYRQTFGQFCLTMFNSVSDCSINTTNTYSIYRMRGICINDIPTQYGLLTRSEELLSVILLIIASYTVPNWAFIVIMALYVWWIIEKDSEKAKKDSKD